MELLPCYSLKILSSIFIAMLKQKILNFFINTLEKCMLRSTYYSRTYHIKDVIHERNWYPFFCTNDPRKRENYDHCKSSILFYFFTMDTCDLLHSHFRFYAKPFSIKVFQRGNSEKRAELLLIQPLLTQNIHRAALHLDCGSTVPKAASK